MTYKELILKKNELENEIKLINNEINDYNINIWEQLDSQGVLKIIRDGVVFEVKKSLTLKNNDSQLLDFLVKNHPEYIKQVNTAKVAILKKEKREIYDNFAVETKKLDVKIEGE